jgi:hypothetical protein
MDPSKLTPAVINSLYPRTYEQSRQRFRDNLISIRNIWPDANLRTHHHDAGSDLTTDWISATATQNESKLLIFTTGEHGIEGYVGSAMLEFFSHTYLPQLNPTDTSILLVHAINPWGMKNFRRTNAHNVDLNRNFVLNAPDLDPAFNPAYANLNPFLNPAKPNRRVLWQTIGMWGQLLKLIPKYGLAQFRAATLLGQYQFPHGLYFGGDQIQPETRLMMNLYRQLIGSHDHIIHLDMHTGYGPRYQMSVVNSVHETRPSTELSAAFNYPLVVNTTPDEFYAMRGDMIDFVYQMVTHDFPDKRLYSTSFEFGTFGASLWQTIRSILAKIRENQHYWQGSVTEKEVQKILAHFKELYYPSETRWKRKALQDANQAFDGILKTSKFV